MRQIIRNGAMIKHEFAKEAKMTARVLSNARFTQINTRMSDIRRSFGRRAYFHSGAGRQIADLRRQALAELGVSDAELAAYNERVQKDNEKFLRKQRLLNRFRRFFRWFRVPVMGRS